jgi:hypothetical protein
MLQQSMIEKLHALMLRVTIAALKQQEQDEGSRLVAPNQVLARRLRASRLKRKVRAWKISTTC